ncbi:MAG: hypothetical protein II049_00105 [Clostridia bacterium]|nr:hypothetical protein [Clostridia bacterium]
MWILIVLFILLFLLLLLSMPLIVEAQGRFSVRGAVVHARLYLLGLIPIPLRLRVYLLASPRFTLIFGKRRVFLLKKRKKKEGKRRIRGIRLLRLDTKTTVGIEDEPAVSVQLAGTIAVLLSMLTTRIAESGSAKARLSENTLLRVTARAQVIVYLLPLMLGIVLMRCITQRKAANNTGKTNEKRKTYASC